MRAPQRVALATRQDEFKLLQKPWQGILLLALHEWKHPVPTRTKTTAHLSLLAPPWRACSPWPSRWSEFWKPLIHLPNVEDVLDDDTFCSLRFAVLTARKTLDADAWDEAHDAAVQERLDLCLADGVHPVWADVAADAPCSLKCPVSQKPNQARWRPPTAPGSRAGRYFGRRQRGTPRSCARGSTLVVDAAPKSPSTPSSLN